MSDVQPLIKTAIISGPTATGKTALSIAFAKKHGKLEIINADSMLVYRGMDIGTAKPTLEERRGVPHHLIDIKNPDEPFTAGAFVRAVEEKLSEIHSRGHRALIVGGTGFYLKALLFGQWNAPPADPQIRTALEQCTTEELFARLSSCDSAAAQKIGSHDRYRLIRALEINRATGRNLSDLQSDLPKDPDPRFKLLVTDRPTAELDQRVRERTYHMIQAGLVSEVEKLLVSYPAARALKAVGYRQTVSFLKNELPSGRKIISGIPGLISEIELATRQLIKQQRTWFKSQAYARFFDLAQGEQLVCQELSSIYNI